MQNSPSPFPQVRVQRPTPNELPSASTPPPMIEESDQAQTSWSNNYQEPSLLLPLTQQPFNLSAYRNHKRVSSGSSVGSVGPDSPYLQPSLYPHIVDPETQSIHSAHLENFDGAYSNLNQYPKQTPLGLNSDHFYNPAYQNFIPATIDAASMMTTQTGMRPALNQRRGSIMDRRQNSSRGSIGGNVDSTTTEMRNTAQLDCTMSDVYQDELYNPPMAASASSSKPRQSQPQGNLLSPHRSAFSDLLQVANNGHLSARSASPINHTSRQRSPFRESSAYAGEDFSNPNTPSNATRVSSAAQMRQQQKLESDAKAYAQHHQSSHHDFMNPSRTISPKEALLDYNESEDDAKLPLFPQVKREPQFPSENLSGRGLSRGTTDDNSASDPNFASMATSRRENSSGSNYTYMPPSVPGMPQEYPFISQSRRQSNSMRSGSDLVPDFPASLTSMESTKSETGETENIRITSEADQSFRSPPSSQEAPIQRPSSTAAGSGSYVCTSSLCNMRFDTASRLQKHRREAHRSSPPYGSTPTTPSSATHNPQAAANNVSRNNAPGPHKCERINPSTNKPCNTVFSRSYDLTRHEDTIHNNRKLKVRCHLCTEEKTFSRNDALTRHMRVVHPDVDYPGKVRRGNDGADVVRRRIEGGRVGR